MDQPHTIKTPHLTCCCHKDSSTDTFVRHPKKKFMHVRYFFRPDGDDGRKGLPGENADFCGIIYMNGKKNSSDPGKISEHVQDENVQGDQVRIVRTDRGSVGSSTGHVMRFDFSSLWR